MLFLCSFLKRLKIGPSDLQAVRLILYIISSRVLNPQAVSLVDGVQIIYWVSCPTVGPIAKLNLCFVAVRQNTVLERVF